MRYFSAGKSGRSLFTLPGDDKGCREETSRSLLSVRLIRLQAGWRRGSAGDEITGLPPGRSKGDGFVKWTDRFYRS